MDKSDFNRGLRIKNNPLDDACNIELFKRECLCKWISPSKEYQEAYKLWLWYNYQCELYDSRVCTGKNEYEDYMPASDIEYKSVNQNAVDNLRFIQNERKRLKEEGIIISESNWLQAKKHFCNYKLKALEKEYQYYFNEI